MTLPPLPGLPPLPKPQQMKLPEFPARGKARNPQYAVNKLGYNHATVECNASFNRQELYAFIGALERVAQTL